MKFISLASSSKGNSTLISYKNTNILVDCGISKKRIEEKLKNYGLTLSDIDCILITHEHGDHISALPIILKNYNICVLSLRQTLMKIFENCEKSNAKIDTNLFKIICPQNSDSDMTAIQINDIKMVPIKSFHDVPSVFYKFYLGDVVIAIATDIGTYNEYIVRSLSDVNYLMLECNYDNDMLNASSYSEDLRNRIRSNKGHLSNVDCSELIAKISNGALKKVYLSHISDDSNSEEFAFEFVTNYLEKNFSDRNDFPDICVAKRLEETIILDC